MLIVWLAERLDRIIRVLISLTFERLYRIIRALIALTVERFDILIRMFSLTAKRLDRLNRTIRVLIF